MTRQNSISFLVILLSYWVCATLMNTHSIISNHQRIWNLNCKGYSHCKLQWPRKKHDPRWKGKIVAELHWPCDDQARQFKDTIFVMNYHELFMVHRPRFSGELVEGEIRNPEFRGSQACFPVDLFPLKPIHCPVKRVGSNLEPTNPNMSWENHRHNMDSFMADFPFPSLITKSVQISWGQKWAVA